MRNKLVATSLSPIKQLVNDIKANKLIVALMLLCLAQYLHFALVSDFTLELLRYSPSWQSLLDSHQYWRLITPMFIHFDIFHLASNMLIFWIFATIIHAYKPNVLMLLLLVAALVSNTAQFLMVNEKFGGISGVDFALFGFVFAFQVLHPTGPMYVNRSVSVVVFAFLAISATDWLGVYSFYAHLSGLVVGIVFGFFCVRREKTKSFHHGDTEARRKD